MKPFICKIILLLLTVMLQANWQKATDVLSAAGGTSGDHFGFSVDVGKDFAVVGAPDDSAGGSIYIFKKESNGTWSQMQRFDFLNSQTRISGLSMSYIDGFGASVAIAENVVYGNINPHLIVVGAPDSYFHTYDDDRDHKTGAICTFEYNASTEIWDRQGSCQYGDLTLDDDHNFGYSVDISNYVMMFSLDGIKRYFSYANIIVGDPHVDSSNYADGGEVTFFDFNRSGDNWNETAVVSNPSSLGDNSIDFGYSVALDKGIAIIGAPGTAQTVPVTIHQMGKAYFYSVDGTYLAKFTPTHTERIGGHYFGTSVDINGEYAIVGELHRLGGDTSGAAYILKKSDANWIENTLLEDSAHGYGSSVAINRSHAAVGAPTRYYLNKELDPVYTGAVFIYDNDGSDNWSKSFYNTGTSQSFFGTSVSLHDNSLMVGAHGAEYVQPYQSLMPFNPALIMYLLD